MNNKELTESIAKYLETIYKNSGFKPNEKQLQDEILDIEDEVNLLHDGDFQKWLRRKDEIKRLYM
jgi:hypothetical protein